MHPPHPVHEPISPDLGAHPFLCSHCVPVTHFSFTLHTSLHVFAHISLDVHTLLSVRTCPSMCMNPPLRANTRTSPCVREPPFHVHAHISP
mmetsp:Transcript_34291/g.60009  ORF Transcript_34291/g.60009 Transcript_34291/m.60009 type:complete len:91 (-) Transcript_34291:462-734(-)